MRQSLERKGLNRMKGLNSTNHRANPKWVWSLTDQACTRDIPVFMKENLLPILGEEAMVQQLLWAFCRVLEEQSA